MHASLAAIDSGAHVVSFALDFLMNTHSLVTHHDAFAQDTMRCGLLSY